MISWERLYFGSRGGSQAALTSSLRREVCRLPETGLCLLREIRGLGMLNPVDFTVAQFQLFILVLLRVTGVIVASPVFGARVVPVQVKVALILLLSLLIFSFVPRVDRLTLPDNTTAYLFYGARELVVGLTLGFAVTVVFAAAQLAGEIIDMQIGFGVANVINPAFDIQGPVIGQFYFLMAILLFLLVDGHHQVLRSLLYSFELIPVGTVQLDSAGLNGLFVDMLCGVFVSAVRIAAPVMVVILLSNISVGLLGRSVMHMNLLVVQFPLYIAIGLLIVSASLGPFSTLMSELFSGVWGHVDTLLGCLRGG